MATVYYPSFDVIRIAADGERIPLLAEDVNVYNVTAAASLGTLTSDADYGIIDSGSFTADLFDVIEISHDTYPLTCRFTLQATADDAFTAVENDISAYIAENLYTDRTESKVARMYIVDLDNTSRQPEYAAEIKPGIESKIHIPQTSTAQNLRLALVSESIEGQFSTSDIKTAAEYFDITIPAAESGTAPTYIIDQSQILDDAMSIIPGPQGKQGEQGPRGIAIPGENGADGESWAIRGADGQQGPRGLIGPPGMDAKSFDYPPIPSIPTRVLPWAEGGTGDAGGAWTSYTPTVTAEGGTFTTVSATGKYRKIGRTVFFQLRVTITAVGTATGEPIATLPFTAEATGIIYSFIGYESGATGAVIRGITIPSVPDKVYMARADYFISLCQTGYVLNVNGTYESTT